MKIGISCFFSCLLLAISSYSQIITPSTKIIETNPKGDDFNDLLPLKEFWKDKRLILLGEQSHEEGTVFKEKVRLIKFLHEEMGFDIIAFESGMYDNYLAFDKIRKGTEFSASPLNKSIFSIWSQSTEVSDLIEYVHENVNTTNELEVAGFDFFGVKNEYWDDLRNEIKLNERDWGKIEEVLIGDAGVLADHPEDTTAFYEIANNISLQFEHKQNKTKRQKIIQQSFKSWLGMVRYNIDTYNEKEILVQNPRDEWMAKNLIFLTDLYPNKKIIAWGASYHFANEVTNFKNTEITKSFIKKMHDNEYADNLKLGKETELFDLDKAMGGAISMGRYLKQYFGEQLYSLAFSAYKGTYGIVYEKKRLTLMTPPKNSIEDKLEILNKENAIVDYSKDDNRNEWFYSSAMGNLPIYAKWRTIFDGLYYIEELEPPHLKQYNNRQQKLSQLKNNEDEGNIYGRIVDSESNEVIPYVNIVLQGTSKGVSSNPNGDFMFNYAKNGALIFSSIGYSSDTLQIANIIDRSNLVVRLKPKSYLLSEIIITDKPLSAQDIIKKARHSIATNYYQSPVNQEVYYKVTDIKDDSVYSNEESSIMLYFEKGFKPKSDIYGNILQNRNVKGQFSDNWSGVGSLWLITSHDAVLDKNNVVFRTNAYDLKIDHVLEYKGRKVYDIFFNCKRPSAFTTGFGYPAPQSASGHIYIATDDYAILKFDICIARKSYTSKKHLTYYPQHHHLSQTYKKSYGKYFLNTSFVEHKSIVLDNKTGKSSVGSSLRYLTTTEVITNNVIPIDLPIISLKVGPKAQVDSSFWQNHNYVPDPGKNQSFYCSDGDVFIK